MRTITVVAPNSTAFEIHAYQDMSGIQNALRTNEVNGAADLPIASIDQFGSNYRVVAPDRQQWHVPDHRIINRAKYE